MRYLQIFVLVAVVLAMPFVASAVVLDNVALNTNVTLHGTFFTDGWGGGLTVPANTVVDGFFFPKQVDGQGHQWDQGPVWWDSKGQNTGQWIEINLGDVYEISKFIVQADDNDWYQLSYRNGTADVWHQVWDIPLVGGWGMQTRPNPASNTQTHDLPTPITATDLKIMGIGSPYVMPDQGMFSDWYYSVSEVQAFGQAKGVPEPATMLLFGAGLAGIWSFRKKIK